MGCENERDIKFEELYQKHYNYVYRICLKCIKNEQEAQDIAQKVFLAFYLRMDKMQLDCAEAYLVRAAKNMSKNWFRDTKRDRENGSLDEIWEPGSFQESAEEAYIHANDKREKGSIMAEVMDELYEENKMWHDIMEFIYFLEMPHDEVAQMLDITKSVLYSKLYRAKKWFAKRYREKKKERSL